MYAFSLTAEQQFDPQKHVERVLGTTGEGDVTIACWEPGQTSPYHCHPGATEIYFCFEGGGTMRTPNETIMIGPGMLSSTRAVSCTSTPTALSVPCCFAYATAERCPAGPRNGRATRAGRHVLRTSSTLH